jgi:hypothetical protein
MAEVGSPRVFIRFDVTLRDLVGEESEERTDERYVALRRGRHHEASLIAPGAAFARADSLKVRILSMTESSATSSGRVSR